MKTHNRYCCRCHRTTAFQIVGTLYTCTGCGVSTDVADRKDSVRSLVGNPLKSFRTLEAA